MSMQIRAAGRTESHELTVGDLKRVPLAPGATATVTVSPAKGFDMGAGPRQTVSREVTGGVVGLILDARGRPFAPPAERAARVTKLAEWNRALDAYPEMQ